MLNDFGDSKVTIKKDDLLNAIRANRNKHASTFEEAHAHYRSAAIVEFATMLDNAKIGKTIQRALTLVEPTQHIDDYDCVIRMLEMSVADEITVTEGQFKNYVLDKWSWTSKFAESTSRYLG